MTPTGRVTAGLIVIAFAAIAEISLTAHSGLRFSSPLEGSALGAAPTHVQLTFIERPEPSLATIRVTNVTGETYQIGQPEILAGDPMTLTIPLRAMPRGIYVVNWRVVSAVDGHATAGAFAFGVEMEPTAVAPSADAPTPDPRFEIVARTLFLLGLIVVIGAASYAVLRLGGAPWLRFATAGTIAAAGGLVLLVIAQSRASDAGLGSLLGTPIGRAWMARGAAIAVAILGMIVATTWRARPGAFLMSLGAITAVAVHAYSGHAAAGRLPVTSTVMFHAIHVIAAGAWIGGLMVVIAGLRNGADTRGLARFSALAAIGLILVTITGVARSIHEVGGWQALTNTTYGGLVLAKAALLVVIAALGALNRWRHLPAAATDTRPLRRMAAAEIALAFLAIVAAGSLATLPPPAAAVGLPGIEVSGTDFATTVTATLRAVSDQPGPNRFGVAIEDFDSGEPISPDRVSLRFAPIDDPGEIATTLALSKDADGRFTGTGANASLDGRWRVNVLIERGNTSVEVPMEIELRGRPQRVSVHRVPNQPPNYTIELGPLGTIELIVDPERPGPARLQISCHGPTTEPLPVRDMVVTVASDKFSAQPMVIRRQDRHQFTTAAPLRRGTNRISVVARTESGARLRANVELRLPDRD